MFDFLKKLYKGGKNCSCKNAAGNICVDVENWMSVVETLRRNADLTVRVRFTNGKLFTIPEFVSGDESKIIGRVNGVPKEFWRKGVMEIEAVPKTIHSFPASFQEGRVTAWKPGRRPCFGFVRVSSGKDFYFNENTILDSRLAEDLDNGRVGQLVRFRLIREGTDGRPSQVEIVELLERGAKTILKCAIESSDCYAQGWRAKNNNQVDEAIRCFRKVIGNKNDVNYFSAIKELAECLNKQEGPNVAFKFLEEHRVEFAVDEQVSIDRMEVLYLLRAKRYEDALLWVRRILDVADLPTNQRNHFESVRLKLEARKGDELSEDGTGIQDKRERRLNSLVGKLADGLTNQMAVLMGKFLGGVLVEARASDDVILNAFNVIAKDVHEFVGTVNYEKRKTVLGSMERRIEVCKKASAGDASGMSMILSLLNAVRDSAASSLAGLTPKFTLAHGRAASYALNEANMVQLNLELSIEDESMPTVKDVMVSVEGQEDSAMLICEEMRGGQKISFEMTTMPSAVGLQSKRETLAVLIDYSVVGVAGESHGACKMTLPVAYEHKALPRIENGYRRYATGSNTPTGKYCVGREDRIQEMYREFTSRRGGKCFLVHGQRRTGKNTTRNNLRDRLQRAPGELRYCVALSSMRGCQSSPQAALYDDLAKSAAETLGISRLDLVNEVNAIISDPQNWTGKIKYLGQKLAKKKFVWIVAIDEFTDLFKTESLRQQVPYLTGMLRTLLDEEVLHVFLVGMDSILQLQDYFANDAEIMEDCSLTYLNRGDTELLLRLPMEEMAGKGCFTSNTTVFDELYDWSGGVPQLAQKLCSGVVEMLNNEGRRRILDGDVERVARGICDPRGLCDPEGRIMERGLCQKDFTTFFEMGIPDFDEKKMLPPFYRKIAELTKDSEYCLKTDIERDEGLFQLLVRRQAIVCEADSVRLKSRLFAEWIRKGGLTCSVLERSNG